MNNWRKVKDGNIPEGALIGYNPDWIDVDFNPDGIRECCLCGDDGSGTSWVSAAWCDEQDMYDTDESSAPTYWMHRPAPPK